MAQLRLYGLSLPIPVHPASSHKALFTQLVLGKINFISTIGKTSFFSAHPLQLSPADAGGFPSLSL